MAKQYVVDATTATVVLCLYAAFGEKVRETTDRALTRRNVYKAGYDEGFEQGYAKGRRVARPVIVPIRSETEAAAK